MPLGMAFDAGIMARYSRFDLEKEGGRNIYIGQRTAVASGLSKLADATMPWPWAALGYPLGLQVGQV